MRFCLLFFSPILAFTLPSGAEIAFGDAQIQRNEETQIEIRAQDTSWIDWKTFSIGRDETVHCILSNEQTLLVHRVIGSEISQILGKFHANGKIVLVNPNGVIFGKDSQIQLASLVATTFDLNQDIFRHKGILHFDSLNKASIKVEGNIAGADSILLKAHQVDLFGKIDVSNLIKAGSIQIEGSFVHLHTGAELLADGAHSGHGGEISFVGQELTIMAGHMSARGGEWGGNGGKLEISTFKELDFTGTVSTLAPQGKIGTLIVDPLDLTVAGANLNVTGATPYTPTAAGATLSAATVMGALAGTNVVITTLGTSGGATGTITINNAISWNAATNLTVSAANDILLNANIQHNTAATGGLTLNATRDVIVSGAAAAVSVGSQNATTQVIAGRNVTIQGGAAGSRSAQIGFYTANGVTSIGPIFISCRDLTMQPGNANQAGAQIGHGRINVLGALPITAAGANISVNATGNVTLNNANNLNSFCVLGHGNGGITNAAPQEGNIQVICGGNISLNASGTGTNSSIQIGHSIPSPNPATGPVLTGNIDIRAAQQLTIFGNGAIGHGGRFTQTSATTLNGDISVCCGADMTLTQSGGAIYIGHFVPERGGFPLTSINGNYHLTVGGNLSMTTLQVGAGPGNCIIGYNDTVRSPLLNVTLDASICGNVSMSVPNISGNSIALGLRSANLASMSRANIVVQGDFSVLSIRNGCFIGCNGFDFNFAIGGDLSVETGVGSSNAFVTSGPNGVTRIYAGGTIFGNPTGGGAVFFGRTNLVGFEATSLDIRAGEDIFFPNTFAAPAFSGPVNMFAGHSFLAGELWTSNGGQIVTICTQTVGLDLLCGTCTPFAAASAAVSANCGTFSLSPNGAVNVNLSTSSSLSVAGLCNACNGSSSVMTIGATPHLISLTNPVGPVTFSGFNVIQINQDITSTGSISMSSCQDLNLNPGSDLTSTGAGSPITLTADADNTGSGSLNLLGGNITSNNGQICLLAAPGTLGCNSNNCVRGLNGLIPGALSSVNQTSGLVTSGSGNIIVTASHEILISGSATSISSTTGHIAINAGTTLTIEENLVSTGGSITTISGQNSTITDALVSALGEIRMIAGTDLSLNGTAIVSSSADSVTLIVDNQFPTFPLIGTGLFEMSCSAEISSGAGFPVRIFTALQNLNNLCSSAQINGFSISDPLFGLNTTPLFQNTPYQVWCTYFACPSPYPFPSLGIPFSLFYKNCLQLVVEQAAIIVDEILVDLHPYDEFPGWKVSFGIGYDKKVSILPQEPYMIRRRNLNLFNHPKSYTLLED